MIKHWHMTMEVIIDEICSRFNVSAWSNICTPEKDFQLSQYCFFLHTIAMSFYSKISHQLSQGICLRYTSLYSWYTEVSGFRVFLVYYWQSLSPKWLSLGVWVQVLCWPWSTVILVNRYLWGGHRSRTMQTISDCCLSNKLWQITPT